MKISYILTAIMVFASTQMNAQTVLVSSDNGYVPKNFIKTNITSIVIKNYSIQYERVLSKSISVALSFRDMPTTTLPFKDKIINVAGADDATAQDVINNLKIGNYAITPEIRFYLSKKGFGRGFYIAPFYRYANYHAENVVVNYDTDNGQKSVDLSGKITSNTGGLMFGAQWALCKFVCLDWWILGPHYGVSSGEMNGIPAQSLTSQEQADVRQKMEDFDIPMIKKTVNVTANKVALIFDGPWAGLRAGISIGISF